MRLLDRCSLVFFGAALFFFVWWDTIFLVEEKRCVFEFSISNFQRRMASLFESAQLLNPTNGSAVSVDSLSGKRLGIYFSAHWCPPCRTFTPVLAQWYKEHKTDAFEFVFVSSDSDEDSFKQYAASMPFPCLSYENGGLKERLEERFGVQGIPTLITVEADGSLISKDGRKGVTSDPANFPWPTMVEEVQPEQGREKAGLDELLTAFRTAMGGNNAASTPAQQREQLILRTLHSTSKDAKMPCEVRLRNLRTAVALSKIEKLSWDDYEVRVAELEQACAIGEAVACAGTLRELQRIAVQLDPPSTFMFKTRSKKWACRSVHLMVQQRAALLLEAAKF